MKKPALLRAFGPEKPTLVDLLRLECFHKSSRFVMGYQSKPLLGSITKFIILNFIRNKVYN
jgi:hypothetical protein